MSGSPQVQLFGVGIDALTMEQTVGRVAELIEAGEPVQHCVLNAAKVVLMARDARLTSIVRSCALVNADGQAIVWAARLLGARIPERVAGIDLFQRLLTLAEQRAYSVYFLGATSEVVAELERRARQLHPRMHIAGVRHGYFTAAQEEDLVAEIAGAQPDILFVALPSPRKEYWLAANLERLGTRFAMGVGGSFDVLAGRTRRAPLWMQRHGLEWIYRLAQEPRRMWRRYLVGNLRFALLVLREARRQRTC